MPVPPSTFGRMFWALFLVCLIASASVGFVYTSTREAQAKTDLAKKINAVQNVLPEFDNNPVEEQYTVTKNGLDWRCFPAKKQGQLVGTAIEAISQQGYGGTIRLMVGFLPDGAIYDIAVLEHRETPGLGDKIDRAKSMFSKQFEKRNPATFKLSVKKDGGDVDAITAATISSRAFCEAVRQAYEIHQAEVKK
jgi:Na+-translocating ferredoxin:NAD+ oxidoreductase subunit G